LANSFLPEFDAAYATLLEDLADRGMLDSTLVIVTGEFVPPEALPHIFDPSSPPRKIKTEPV
jgi:Protein of unknown function (DUF1501)